MTALAIHDDGIAHGNDSWRVGELIVGGRRVPAATPGAAAFLRHSCDYNPSWPSRRPSRSYDLDAAFMSPEQRECGIQALWFGTDSVGVTGVAVASAYCPAAAKDLSGIGSDHMDVASS